MENAKTYRENKEKKFLASEQFKFDMDMREVTGSPNINSYSK